jgi:hypothetical protein
MYVACLSLSLHLLMFVISRASINYTEENLTKLELYLQHKTLLLTPKTQTLLLSST